MRWYLGRKTFVGRALATFSSAVAVLLVSLRLGARMHLPSSSEQLPRALPQASPVSSGTAFRRLFSEVYKTGCLPSASLLLVGMIVGLWFVGGTIPTPNLVRVIVALTRSPGACGVSWPL